MAEDTNVPQPVLSGKPKMLWGAPLKSWIVPGLVLMVLLIGAGAWLYRANKNRPKEPYSDPYLRVVGVYPSGVVKEASNIYITFSEHVDGRDIEDFIELSPRPAGGFAQSADPHSVMFVPEFPFPAGFSMQIRVKKGLKALGGKILPADFNSYISIVLASQGFYFRQDGKEAKLMSGSANRPKLIDVVMGPEIKNPRARLYKVKDVKVLLDSLVFSDAYNPPPLNVPLSKFAGQLELVEEYAGLLQKPFIEFNRPPGIFLLKAFDGNKELLVDVFVISNSIGLHYRQDDQKVILAAQDLNTGQAVSGVNIELYDLKDSAKVVAISNLSVNGIFEATVEYPQRVDLVLGRKGEEIMAVPVSVPFSQADIKVYENLKHKRQIFLYTERPIYKPGDTVKFRLIVRQDNDALYSLPRGVKISVVSKYYGIYDPSKPTANQTVDLINREYDVPANGILSGEFRLPEDLEPGVKDINAQIPTGINVNNYPSYNTGYAYFDVAAYTKPEFELKVSTDKDEYIRGETMKAKIIGSYFAGQPLANREITYTVYARDFYEAEKRVFGEAFRLSEPGGMCGGGFDPFNAYYGEALKEKVKIKLNAQGEANIDIPLDFANKILSQDITILAKDADKFANEIVGARSAVMHAGEFNVFFRNFGQSRWYTKYIFNNKPITAVFYAENSIGEALGNREFEYVFSKRIWQNNDKESFEKIKEGKVKTEFDGTGVIKFTPELEDGKPYSLTVRSRDSLGNLVEAKTDYVAVFTKISNTDPYFQEQPQNVLEIISKQNNLEANKNYSLEVNSPDEITAFATFDRGRIYAPEWLNLKKGRNLFEFTVADEFMPSITPTFTFFYEGKFHAEGLSLNVPAMNKLISVDVTQDKLGYKPGETATLTITTKDRQGSPIESDFSLAIVDKAIFALRKDATPPLHSSLYFFRPRATNISSSLTWIFTSYYGDGRGGGGGDSSYFDTEADTLYWNGNLKTGKDGKLTVAVPLNSAETIWQALVFASTDDTKLGQAQAEISVRK